MSTDSPIKMLTTRERILSAASALFYKEGYKITGVDRIAKEAGITKATLYHHFQNKDHLIEESLQFLSKTFKQKCQDAWQTPGFTPEEKLLSIFDVLHVFFGQDDCYGCPFIKAASEFEDPETSIRKIAKEHCAFVLNELKILATQANLLNPEQVCEQIFMAIMGAYSGWSAAGLSHGALQAKEMARLVIENHRPSKKAQLSPY